MTDLDDLVEPLKREVAVPGTFATLFPDTTDRDLGAALLDAYAQAQLDGFLLSTTAADDGVVTPDLSRGARALVVIYAGIRFLTVMLINRTSHSRYEARGAVFEQDYAASVLSQALKDLQAKKATLIANAQAAQRAAIGVTVVDGYFVKATDFYGPELTLAGGTAMVLGTHDPTGL